MSYRFADSLWTGSCSQAVSKPVWHKPLLCVQWKTPDDGEKNCPKHVEDHDETEFHPDPARKQSANPYGIFHCRVQWKTPDDGQRNCPKHVECHSKHKFVKLVHLVGFIIRNLSRCTVTWTSDYLRVFQNTKHRKKISLAAIHKTV
jgi:hypothetical protein